MMVSLEKVEHEVLCFGQTASKWNQFGLQSIIALPTEALAKRWSMQFKLRHPDRSCYIRRAMI